MEVGLGNRSHTMNLAGIQCSKCGAKETRKNQFNRFLKRHPSLCQKKAEEKQVKDSFTKQLGEGTRSVAEDEGEFVDGMPTVEA